MADIVLASGSASRKRLLSDAGVQAEAISPQVDEDAAKAGLRAQQASVSMQAMALAELKALKISSTRPGLVIGGDQMLNLEG
ncbi:MAG: Maf family protein, partial [Pseudomonadota bacterium]